MFILAPAQLMYKVNKLDNIIILLLNQLMITSK